MTEGEVLYKLRGLRAHEVFVYESSRFSLDIGLWIQTELRAQGVEASFIVDTNRPPYLRPHPHPYLEEELF